jgi:hypothetical protein
MLYRTEVESYGQGAALVGREEVPVKEVEILRTGTGSEAGADPACDRERASLRRSRGAPNGVTVLACGKPDVTARMIRRNSPRPCGVGLETTSRPERQRE